MPEEILDTKNEKLIEIILPEKKTPTEQFFIALGKSKYIAPIVQFIKKWGTKLIEHNKAKKLKKEEQKKKQTSKKKKTAKDKES